MLELVGKIIKQKKRKENKLCSFYHTENRDTITTVISGVQHIQIQLLSLYLYMNMHIKSVYSIA